MSKRNAIRAVSLLWLGSVFGAALAFLTQVFIARKLSTEDFGIYSSSLSFISLLIPLATFGIPQFWLKVFGEEGWRALRWIKNSLSLVLIATSIIVVFFIFWIFIFGNDIKIVKIFYFLLFFLLGQVVVELVSGKLQLEEKYLYLAVWQFLPNFFRFLLILFLFIIIDDYYFYGIGVVYLIVGLFFTIYGFFILYKLYVGDFDLVGHGKKISNYIYIIDSPSIKSVIESSFPFGAAGVFHLIYFQSAIVLLAYISGPESAGIYNVAFLVMSAVYLFPNVVYQKYLLPKIHRWANHDRELFIKSYKFGSMIMFCSGCVICLFVLLLSPYIITLLFGDKYIGSIEVLQILSLCAPLRFLATSIGSVLLTQSHMYKKVKYMGAVAIISILLNLLLIPWISIHGALMTTLVSEFLLLGLYYFSVKKFVFNKVIV